MKPTRNYVLVEREERFDDTFETPSGFKFYKPLAKHSETHDVGINAVVVAIPDDVPCTNTASRRAKGIVKEVQVGDKIYFNYLSLLNEDNWVLTEKGTFYRIGYENIFCAVRDGEIIPIGGWALVEPHKEQAVKTGGLINPFESERKNNHTVGIVRHIGTPKVGGEDLTWLKGKKVGFPLECSFENEIEGVTYYCMEQDQIYVYEDVC